MNDNITFLYDFISPYAYLALDRIQKSPILNKKYIHYCPISLFMILEKTGNPGPMRIENKDNYYINDTKRCFNEYGFIFNHSNKLPFFTQHINRFIHSIDNEKIKANISLFIFEQIWQKSQVPDNDEQLLKVLKKSPYFKQEWENIAQFIKENNGRKIFKQANQDAFQKYNAFGVPTMIYKDELFWGHDRIQQLEYKVTSTN